MKKQLTNLTKNNCFYIINSDNCIGCGNCVSICPKACLKLEKDAAGFTTAVLRAGSNCIECGLCLQYCPQIPSESSNDTLPECFAAWHKDPEKVQKCSSGGASLALAETVIKRGGIVAGVVMQNNQAVYKLADSLEKLQDFCGSKYIPADINDIADEIEKLLSAEKTVLFPALPCAAAALRKRFDRKKLPGKLYLVDMVCAGVPSPEYLRREMQKINAECTAFRIKTPPGSWRESKFLHIRTLYDNNIKLIPIKNSPFYNAFACSQILRSSCYDCRHARLHRVSDLTIADFWGEKRFPEQQAHGISMILINSQTGKELLKDTKDLELHRASITDAASKNPRIYFGINFCRDYWLRKHFAFAVEYLPLWLLHFFYGGGYRRKILGKLPYRIFWSKHAKHRRLIEKQAKEAFMQLQQQINSSSQDKSND